MNAIILVAGVARRLAPLTNHTHKALLEVGGRPILGRMLEALEQAGTPRAVLVVGHQADRVRAYAKDRFGRMTVTYVENPEYRKGSALSVYAARHELADGALVMDADVLFPRALLRRLIESQATSAVLLDRDFTDSGEEVKVYTRGDRVIALGKRVRPEVWDAVGEGVGFFKCGADAATDYVRCLEAVIRERDGLEEYEEAMHRLVAIRHVGWVDVTGLPWTEIDFAEDLRRAEREVLPRVVRLDGE